MAGGSDPIVFNPFHPDYANDTRDLAQIMWPLDFGTVGKEADGTRQFVHWRTAEASELRGRIRLVPAKIAHGVSYWLYPDGHWTTDNYYAGLIGDRWVSLDHGMVNRMRRAGGTLVQTRSEATRDEISRSLPMLMSLAFTERYSWHAALGRGNCRIMLPTNPQGCLDLFGNRMRCDYEQRRAALRHWVKRHFREQGSMGLAYVRDHLRGATEFNWYDLDCSLQVSEFDLERNEYFKAEADAWRAQRQHNRVRVRLK